MELIIFSVRIVYWLFVAPVWWSATYLASYFYPYEGDSRNFTLSLLFALILGGLVYGFLWYLLLI